MNRKKAIDAHCRSCSYDPLDVGTWRYQVENCMVTSCDLYAVRPKTYQKKACSQNETEKEGYPTSSGSCSENVAELAKSPS